MLGLLGAGCGLGLGQRQTIARLGQCGESARVLGTLALGLAEFFTGIIQRFCRLAVRAAALCFALAGAAAGLAGFG